MSDGRPVWLNERIYRTVQRLYAKPDAVSASKKIKSSTGNEFHAKSASGNSVFDE